MFDAPVAVAGCCKRLRARAAALVGVTGTMGLVATAEVERARSGASVIRAILFRGNVMRPSISLVMIKLWAFIEISVPL